jgi:pyridinium-3,5-bisthiocarboxylic acid mononucleotide nickel chelatase
MCLAALVDAGVPLSYLQGQLSTLGLDNEFSLTVTPTHHQGLRALYAQVALNPGAWGPDQPPQHDQDSNHAHDHAHGHQLDHGASRSPAIPEHPWPHRNLPAIEHLITQSSLPDRVQRWSLAIFRRLGEAEAAVHGIPIDQVHFHEVGATDAIVDIVGTCLGLDYLDIDILICSPLPTGQGQVRAAHGWLPVPAPAVLKLLEQGRVPLYSNGLEGELVTPTGAAIATVLAQNFGPPPAMILHRIGLGAGQKKLAMPNILRLWIGEPTPGRSPDAAPMLATPDPAPNLNPNPKASATSSPYSSETLVQLETQVDDMLPQAIGFLYDRLFASGALDIFTQPVGMKKNRPGWLITVLCRPSTEDACVDLLFRETSTLGIRRQPQQRWVLPRQFKTLATPYGSVTIKVAHHPYSGAILNAQPEYEDCAALARRHGVPWHEVHGAALSAWHSQQANS